MTFPLHSYLKIYWSFNGSTFTNILNIRCFKMPFKLGNKNVLRNYLTASYKEGARGSSSCEGGEDITTEAACKVAALALGRSWRGFTSWKIPVGCFTYRNTNVYYSDGKGVSGGKLDDRWSPLCYVPGIRLYIYTSLIIGKLASINKRREGRFGFF